MKEEEPQDRFGSPPEQPFYEKRRPEAFLDPIKTPPKERPFMVFDIESKDGDTQKGGFTRPFQVGFYDGNEYISFRNEPHLSKMTWYERCISPGGCIDKLMRHVIGAEGSGLNPYDKFDLYAHNMGAFDGLFLPAWLERNNQWISYKIMPIQARIQALEVWRFNRHRFRGTSEAQKAANKKDRKQNGMIRILDSVRIMPAALDKIAIAFGLEGKLKGMSFDTDENDPMWEAYNKVDCIQLYQVIQKYKEMIHKQLGGEVGITAPSTAIKLLRRKYLPEDYKIHRNVHFANCDPDVFCQGCAHEFFRSAYFGGRTEIFNKKGTGSYFDVNSSYPFSMTKPQPVGEMTELGENADFTKYANNPDYVGYVRCTVDIPVYDPVTKTGCYIPPLPVQHGGKLKFPVGRFSGTWDWVELNALRHVSGKILHVEKSVWVRGHSFLTPFVQDLYAMRKAGSPQYKGAALSEVAKIMLNSTFGKFGMDQDRMEMIILKPGEAEPWEARYPGESEEHREKRKKAKQTGDHKFHIATQMPGEPTEHFAKRKKAEKTGDNSLRWRVPELPTASGIYEHDSLVRIRDIRIDAAYIIPQIAAHITASSRVLLWSYCFDIINRCQICTKCLLTYEQHMVCKKCHTSVVDHHDKHECQQFVPPCTDYQECKQSRASHEMADHPFINHKILYSDTDSILTSFGNFPDSKELGGLKKEYSEPITIESYAPKMYRLLKATLFAGSHSTADAGKQCLEKCPGCLKAEKNDKRPNHNGCVIGEHKMKDDGKRDCKEACPGCSREKIMMKGVPKDMRTFETIEKLLIKREEISYKQHEKLGALAKRGFRDTPQMQTIKKSLKSEYDKRIMDPDTGDTKPIVLADARYLSPRFKEIVSDPSYLMPPWLISATEPN